MNRYCKYGDIPKTSRMKREWFRLDPEYGEDLHLMRLDISKYRFFLLTMKIAFNRKPWRGWWIKATPDDSWHGRFSHCRVGVPFYYEASYEYHMMGQHEFNYCFRFLNLVTIQAQERRDLNRKEILKRFRRRFNRPVFSFAAAQEVRED